MFTSVLLFESSCVLWYIPSLKIYSSKYVISILGYISNLDTHPGIPMSTLISNISGNVWKHVDLAFRFPGQQEEGG